MREVGLIPSNTGTPGGKEIGQKMSHYIDNSGRFHTACAALLSLHELSLYNDRDEEIKTTRKKKAASKTKYTCPGCNLNAWAKPDTALMCAHCLQRLEAEIKEEDEEAA